MKQLLLLAAAGCQILFAQQWDVNNRFMLAQSYEQIGEFQKAKDIYEELYLSQPDNHQYFLALNKMYLQMKEFKASANLIQEKITASPKDINLYGMLGSTHYLMGDEEEAYSVWDGALTKVPFSIVNYKLIANYAIESRTFSKAIDILKKGKKLSGEPELFSYDLAQLYSLTMRYSEAAEEYCSILEKSPSQLRSVESKILAYISKPEALNQTMRVIERYAGGGNIAFMYLLASMYIEGDMYDKAFDLYLKIDRQTGSSGSEIFNFAQRAYSEQKFSEAFKAFETIIREHADSPFASNAKLGYAKTLEASLNLESFDWMENWRPSLYVKREKLDKYPKVVSAYEELTKVYANSEIANEAYLRIGKLRMYKMNEPDEAEKSFLHLNKQAPLSQFTSEANEELSKIELRKGNLLKSREYLQKILQSTRSTAEQKNSAKFTEAKIFFYQKRFEESRKILNELLTNLKENQANDAIELSLLISSSFNDSSALAAYAEGEFLSVQEKFQEALDKFNGIASNKRAFLLSKLSQLKMAEIYLVQADYPKAINLLEIISDDSSGNIYGDKSLYLLGKIYRYPLNNPGKAIEIYEELLSRYPNSVYLEEVRESIILLKTQLS